MFTYRELFKINVNYFRKTNHETGKREIYDKNEKKFVNDEEEKSKLGAALTIFSSVIRYANINKVELSETQKLEDITKEFQNSMSNLLMQNNEVSIKGFLKRRDKVMVNYFIGLALGEVPQYEDENKNLMNYLARQNGKKISDINFNMHAENDTAIKVKWKIEEIPFKERLAFNHPNQNKNRVELTDIQKENRRKFVEELIATYRMVETNEDFKERCDEEYKNMKYVADAVNLSKNMSDITSAKSLIRKLIAAQNLNLEGEKDFLEEMMSIPEVNEKLIKIKKEMFEKMKTKAQENNVAGKIGRNGAIKGNYETQGEISNRIANNAIKRDSNVIKNVQNQMGKGNNKFSLYDATPRIMEILERRKGKNPQIIIKDNIVEYNSEEMSRNI